MTAVEAARRTGYAAQSELALREAVETFCRERWAEARVVHELVMSEGKVRADIVAIGTDHIAAFEVKGSYDDVTRLMHQVGMFQLCVPEVWMICAENHSHDAKLIRHLLPSVGLMVATGMDRGFRWGQGDGPVVIEIEAEPSPRPVVSEMMLQLLWATELEAICARLVLSVRKRSTRPQMIKALIGIDDPEELQRQTCIALRGRDALWRADDPIPAHGRGARRDSALGL